MSSFSHCFHKTVLFSNVTVQPSQLLVNFIKNKRRDNCFLMVYRFKRELLQSHLQKSFLTQFRNMPCFITFVLQKPFPGSNNIMVACYFKNISIKFKQRWP